MFGNWAWIPQIMCRDTWRIIQSFQLLVSHQIRPCFSVMVVCRLSYTCSTGTQVLGQFGETRLEYPKSCAGRHENQSKVLSSLFLINWDLTLVPKPLLVELYLVHRYSEIGAIWGNWPQIPQITCRNTWKVIQSLWILISHQLRPYSRVKVLCWVSYTCFTGTWY